MVASATRGLSHTADGSSRRNAWFKLSRPQPHLGGTVSVVRYFFWSRSDLFTQQGMDQSPHPPFRVSVDRKLTGPLARQRQVRERDHSDPDVVIVLISAVTGKCAQSRVQSLGCQSSGPLHSAITVWLFLRSRPYLFQFPFADTDQYCHSGWLITVTFFWTGYKHGPLAPNCRVLKNPVWCGFTWKKFIVEDGLGSGVVFWTGVAHVHDRTLLPVPFRSY